MQTLTIDKMIISWAELEVAWIGLSEPAYRSQITGLIAVLKKLSETANPRPMMAAVTAITTCLMSETKGRPDGFLMSEWSELEAIWSMLALPHQFQAVPDTVDALRQSTLSYGPETAAATFVGATAWLTEELGRSTPG